MEVRDRITEEATKQFFQYGIRSVTMDDIAVSLGISKRTVYENFKDKGDLVLTCLNKLKVCEDENIKSVVSNSQNSIEATFVFMEVGLKAITSINPVFYKDLEKLYPEIMKDMVEESRKKRFELSNRLLISGIQDGFFRENLNVELIAKLFLEQMNLLGNEIIFPRDKYDTKEIFKNMVMNFTRGISTKKGIDLIDKLLE